MWAYQLAAPRQLERVESPQPHPADLPPHHVVLRSLAGGICGSDIPKFEARAIPAHPDGVPLPGLPGYPLHEIVGEVITTTHADLPVGSHVVGWSTNSRGCAEYVMTDGRRLAMIDDSDPLRAVLIQPLACVIHALDRIDVQDKHVAVVGLGPIGLLFAHVARTRGAAAVTGVDPLDRSAISTYFGINELVTADSEAWVHELGDGDRPSVCIEAVGHQTATLNHALHATRLGGTVLYFGIPDQAIYPVDVERLMRAHLHLIGGVTRDHHQALVAAREHAAAFPDLHDWLTSHTFDASQAQQAFECASSHDAGRLKVLIDFTS